MLGVVGGIADQEDEPVAHGFGLREAGPDQRPADALTAQGGINRNRPQQQRLLAAEQDRPVADGAHEPPALARHHAELRYRRDADPIPIGDLAAAITPEGEIQKVLDFGPMVRALRYDLDHDGLGTRRGGGRASA
jgi:hypothetical protein